MKQNLAKYKIKKCIGRQYEENHFLDFLSDRERIITSKAFRRLEYDIKTTQQKILDAGLPKVLADRLGEGR